MYPRDYFSMFPPFPRRPRAFVATSFDDWATPRWEKVLEPALSGLKFGNDRVQPFRVNLSKASDAILTEILEAIADSAFIVADVTAHDELNDRPIRNANVMYEVGLAHAVRLPQEVILFRSDNKRLDFDVQGVRVHRYSPDSDPPGAIKVVRETVLASFAALEGTRRAVLRDASERLTTPALTLLLHLAAENQIRYPQGNTMGAILGTLETKNAIALLLGLGAMRAVPIKLTDEILDQLAAQDANLDMLDYSLTAFGDALVKHMFDRMGFNDAEMQQKLKARFEKQENTIIGTVENENGRNLAEGG